MTATTIINGTLGIHYRKGEEPVYMMSYTEWFVYFVAKTKTLHIIYLYESKQI